MMPNKRIRGKCHICGEHKVLSYEHVPPVSCFNNRTSRIYKGMDMVGATNKTNSLPWEIGKLTAERNIKYEQKQKGIGWCTLCERCNNNTGSWYANSYGDLARQGYLGLKAFGLKNIKHENGYTISFKNIYPLRILKQILAMFCSINSPNFCDTNKGIREYILNKESKIIDSSKYCLYLYISMGKILRYCGESTVMNVGKDLNVLGSRTVSELTAIPFGHLLEIDPAEDRVKQEGNLFSLFSSYDYREKVDMDICLPALEVNTLFPLDYRTKSEIKSDIEKTNGLTSDQD
jgi:hypothetical protein